MADLDNELKVVHIKDLDEPLEMQVGYLTCGFLERHPEIGYNCVSNGSDTKLFTTTEHAQTYTRELDQAGIPYTMHPESEYPRLTQE